MDACSIAQSGPVTHDVNQPRPGGPGVTLRSQSTSRRGYQRRLVIDLLDRQLNYKSISHLGDQSINLGGEIPRECLLNADVKRRRLRGLFGSLRHYYTKLNRGG